jgi:hypothetical protein
LPNGHFCSVGPLAALLHLAQQFAYPTLNLQSDIGGFVSTLTNKWFPQLCARAGIEGCVFHDLRRTARTMLGKVGTRPAIGEGILNHVHRGVAGVYDRYDYFDEKRDALLRNVMPLRVDTASDLHARAECQADRLIDVGPRRVALQEDVGRGVACSGRRVRPRLKAWWLRN